MNLIWCECWVKIQFWKLFTTKAKAKYHGVWCECWVKIQFWKLFTTTALKTLSTYRCECWVKIQFWKLFTTNLKTKNNETWCECWVKIQFWKLFTTTMDFIWNRYKVWMLGKNTILKAIHNGSHSTLVGRWGVNAG